MPYVERKAGMFRDWTEDHEQAEIRLPLPPGTVKKDIVLVLTAEKLDVRHVKLKKTLLLADPLAGIAVPEESTWYVDADADVLVVVIAKAEIGANKSEQYWGATLATKTGTLECYLSLAQLKSAKEACEAKEKQQEADRLARAKSSQRALRAAEEAEKEKEEKEARKEARREARRARAREDDEAAEAAARQRAARREARESAGLFGWVSDVGFSWVWMGFGLAALAILFDVGVRPLLGQLIESSTQQLFDASGGALSNAASRASGEPAGGDSWIDDDQEG
jgi:hypothetical protein